MLGLSSSMLEQAEAQESQTQPLELGGGFRPAGRQTRRDRVRQPLCQCAVRTGDLQSRLLARPLRAIALASTLGPELTATLNSCSRLACRISVQCPKLLPTSMT